MLTVTVTVAIIGTIRIINWNEPFSYIFPNPNLQLWCFSAKLYSPKKVKCLSNPWLCLSLPYQSPRNKNFQYFLHKTFKYYWKRPRNAYKSEFFNSILVTIQWRRQNSASTNSNITLLTKIDQYLWNINCASKLPAKHEGICSLVYWRTHARPQYLRLKHSLAQPDQIHDYNQRISFKILRHDFLELLWWERYFHNIFDCQCKCFKRLHSYSTYFCNYSIHSAPTSHC